MSRILAIVLLWAWAALAQGAAPAPKPFGPGSMREVVAAQGDKPFILAFWSLSCAHCKANLEQFGRLARRHPQLPLVLVATDTPEEGAGIAAVLDRYHLDQAQSWVFADDFVERLYFEIDRKWRGELPRTYFFEAGQAVRALSGKLDEAEIERWIVRPLGR